jgi:hypothetical protein
MMAAYACMPLPRLLFSCKYLLPDAAREVYRRRKDASRQWRWPGEDEGNEGTDGGALSMGRQ